VKIIFATQNENKVKEIQSQVDQAIKIQSLLDIPYTKELEETSETLEGNALQKARFVYEKFGLSCFADDTGLEVEALDGAPGVYSARYAGEAKSFEANMDKLLEELKNSAQRSARFRTVIACIIEGKEYLFEGICEGEITRKKKGEKGFGYDPVFLPKGYTETFAEMELSEKIAIGHRGKAVKKLIDFLTSLS
jgi:XTP/dITP diphosphohydrolase